MKIIETHLNLAHLDLQTVSNTLLNNKIDESVVQVIDVSNNSISDGSFVKLFRNLTSLILDHNYITDDVVFPFHPNIEILWLNHNHIHNYIEFVKNLSSSFPRLKQLSLMGNPGMPKCTEETFYEYIQFRHYVISRFDDLEHLDDRNVTDYEKEESKRLFGPPILEKYVSNTIPNVFKNAVNKFREFIKSSSDEEQSHMI